MTRIALPFLFLPTALLLVFAPGIYAQKEARDKEPAEQAQTGKKDPTLEKYFIATAAFNRKLYPVAVSQFEGFLEEHGTHAKADLARRGLALSLYALKQYDKALPHLSALVADKDLDAAINIERIIMLYGQCMTLTGKRQEAQELFVAQIEKLKSEDYRTAALAVICDVSFSRKAWEEVGQWSGQLLAGKLDDEQRARGLYQQGYAYYQLKKTAESVEALSKITPLKANKLWSTRANYLLGACFNLLKKHDKAELAFVAALPGLKGPEALECLYRLGLARFVLKKYPEAAVDLAGYLEKAANGTHAAEARFYIARSLLEQGGLEKSEAEFAELAAGEGAIAAKASLWRARVLTRGEKDYARAAEVLGDAVERFGDSALITDIRFDYANVLMAVANPDWKQALALLKEVEGSDAFQQKAELLSQRAVCQHKLKDYEGSLATGVQFLADHGDHPLAADGRFVKAENLLLLKRLEEAEKAYGEFLVAHEDHPNRVIALFRTSQIHHGLGRWEECLKTAQPLLADPPQGRLFAQLPFIVGDCLFRQEKWQPAAASLQRFVAPRIQGEKVIADQNVDTALMQLAVAYERVGKKELAREQLAMLLNQYPQPTSHLPLALTEQGRLAYEGNDLKTARLAFERFITEEGKGEEPFKTNAAKQRIRVMYYLGWVDAREEKNDSAAKRFGQVVEIDKDHKLAPDAVLQQGIAWIKEGDFEAAAKHFPQVQSQYPKHGKMERVVYYTGFSQARQKDWSNAAAQFKKLVANYPESELADRALYEWAWCERELKNIKGATSIYQQLLEDYPQSSLNAKVHSELAELNLAGGSAGDVIAQLTKVMAGVKDKALLEDIRYQLASAHFKNNDHKTAVGQFEGMLVDYPDSKLLARILFHAGECQLQLKDNAAAHDHFAAAAEIPGSPETLAESINMRLAEAQANSGKHAEAKATYVAFLTRFTESRWRRNATFGLALATEMAGDPASAIPEYRKLMNAGDIDLWTVRSRYQIGRCQVSLKKYDDAVVEFVAIEINHPQYPLWQGKAVLEVGKLLMQQDKAEQAVEQFKDLIKRFKESEEATIAQQYIKQIEAQ